MALSDFLKQNGYGNIVPQPLTFKLAADTKVLYDFARIRTLKNGGFEVDFVDEDKDDKTEDVTKEYAFISFARVWNAEKEAYDLTNPKLNFCETSEATEVSVTETLKLEDAEAEGIDTTGQTGPTMQVTHNKGGWAVVSCVKEIEEHKVVYDGSKAVTINLF